MKNCTLSKSLLKFTSRFFQLSSTSRPNSGREDVGVDVWSEILLKVDPFNIFKCILISKVCLQVITSPDFRRIYLDKWKDCFKDCFKDRLMGFMNRHGVFQLVGRTNDLGNLINDTKLMRHFEFRSKSSSGLILCVDNLSETLYVFNLATSDGGVIVTPLPRTPYSLSSVMDIISSENDSFKVVISHADRWEFSIQTFCSSTLAWDKVKMQCSIDTTLLISRPSGIFSEGMMCWPAHQNSRLGLVVFDTRNLQQRRLSLIWAPGYFPIEADYDVSPRGNIRCASTESNMIRIWERNIKNGGGWDLLYKMDADSVWAVNSGLSDIIERNDVMHPFKFVSFVPGRPDSIFVVVADGGLFIYNVHTKLLEKCEHVDCTGIRESLVPFTMADLGVWPSSPFSNHPPRNKFHTYFSHPPVLLRGSG